MDFTLTVQQPFDQIIRSLTGHLEQRNLQAQISFNACLAQVESGGHCPHHGQEQCNCRYAVLLIYSQDQLDYRTITIYGRDEIVWLTLIWQPTHPGQNAEAHEALEILLLGILLSLSRPAPVTA